MRREGDERLVCRKSAGRFSIWNFKFKNKLAFISQEEKRKKREREQSESEAAAVTAASSGGGAGPVEPFTLSKSIGLEVIKLEFDLSNVTNKLFIIFDKLISFCMYICSQKRRKRRKRGLR